MYLCKERTANVLRLTRHLGLYNEVIATQQQGEGVGLCRIAWVFFHSLYCIEDFLVVFLDEVGHGINRTELLFAYGYLRKLAIGECLLHGKQVGVGFLCSLLCGLYLSLQLGLGIVDIGLVGLPLLSAALVLSHILLRIVFQQGILATRKLRHGITEHIFFLFKHTVVHAVLHQSVALHHAVGNRSLGFQSLIGCYIKAVLHTETEHTYWLAPLLVQVALSQDTAIALCVVHRSVGRIEVNKGVQTLLYVHACTKGGCTAEYHTHLATVHLVEDFQLLLDGHTGFHHNNLTFGYALRYEFLLDVLIQVETAALVLVVVGKDGHRSLVVVRLFQRAQGLAHGLVGLALWIILCVHLNKSGIDSGSLCYAIHGERNAAVLFLLLAAHFVKAFEFITHILHHAAQGACLWQIDVLCLAALHFGYFLHQLGLVFGQHGVGHSRPDTHQFGQVHISCKAVHFLELAACAKFGHLLYVAEVAHEVVKVVDAVLLHGVLWHEVAHESPYLCGSVADRRTSGKDDVTSVVLLQHGLCL